MVSAKAEIACTARAADGVPPRFAGGGADARAGIDARGGIEGDDPRMVVCDFTRFHAMRAAVPSFSSSALTPQEHR
jgi:hypothetical protein